MTASNEQHWSDGVHRVFTVHDIRLVSYVPDGGLARLIDRCQADPHLKTVSLTTEEEGVALSAGAFLGGMRSVVLMQSSGVGNIVNMLSLPRICNIPFVGLVTMRGEWGEFNPWQVPMGQAAQSVLEAMGGIVYRVEVPVEVPRTVDSAIKFAYQSRQRVMVLVAQQVVGTKEFTRGEK